MKTNPAIAKRVEASRRQAKSTTCPKCHAEILKGDDHDRVAAVASVDPAPVDELHEVVGLLMGRSSYELDHGELHYRETWHYSRRVTVVLEHRCAA
jgi:hypothetical protein